MYAELQSVFNGANAMFVQRARLVRTTRQIIVRFLLWLEGPALQKGNLLLEHPFVPNTRDVAAGDVGEPQIVIGNPGAHSPAGWWMPPMLHVAFTELIRRRTQK